MEALATLPVVSTERLQNLAQMTGTQLTSDGRGLVGVSDEVIASLKPCAGTKGCQGKCGLLALFGESQPGGEDPEAVDAPMQVLAFVTDSEGTRVTVMAELAEGPPVN